MSNVSLAELLDACAIQRARRSRSRLLLGLGFLLPIIVGIVFASFAHGEERPVLSFERRVVNVNHPKNSGEWITIKTAKRGCAVEQSEVVCYEPDASGNLVRRQVTGGQ